MKGPIREVAPQMRGSGDYKEGDFVRFLAFFVSGEARPGRPAIMPGEVGLVGDFVADDAVNETLRNAVQIKHGGAPSAAPKRRQETSGHGLTSGCPKGKTGTSGFTAGAFQYRYALVLRGGV